MPNCDFYALRADCVDVLEFLFSQPGWMLYELSSRGGQPTRKFESTASVVESVSLGEKPTHFNLYAPEMRGSLVDRRITFKPGLTLDGAAFRHAMSGWGLIQLYFGFARDGGLTASHTNHNTETRAHTWSDVSSELGDPADWDWPAVNRISGRLVRHIRSRSSARAWRRPVLPAAATAVERSEIGLLLNG